MAAPSSQQSQSQYSTAIALLRPSSSSSSSSRPLFSRSAREPLVYPGCPTFDEIDTNKDGFLTRKELNNYCRRKDIPLTYVDQLFNALGDTEPSASKNSEKGITRSAFCKYASKREASVFEEFLKLDPTGTGAGRIKTNQLTEHIQKNGICFLRPVTNATACAPTQKIQGACPPTACPPEITNEAPLTKVRVPKSCEQFDTKAMLTRVSRRSDNTIGYEEFRDFVSHVPLNACQWKYWADPTTGACIDTGTCFTCPPRDARDVDTAFKAAVAAKHWRWRAKKKREATIAAEQKKVASQGNPISHLIAGTTAGAFSRTVTAPLETVRIRLATGQVPTHLTAHAGSAAVGGGGGGGGGVAVATKTVALNGGERAVRLMQHIVRDEGVKGLWSGNVATVMRFAPTKGIDFFSYEMYKRLLMRVCGNEDVTSAQAISAGAAAGLTSTLLLYPLELARTRLITRTEVSRGGVRGVVDVLRNIAKQHGVAGMYRGLRPTLLGIVPEAGITYGSFDLFKRNMLISKRTRIARQRSGNAAATAADATDVKLAAWEGIMCGIAAALLGQSSSYPLETLGRRAALGAAASGVAAAGPRAALASFAGLYSGWGTASVKVLPMALLSFGTYEVLRAAMD